SPRRSAAIASSPPARRSPRGRAASRWPPRRAPSCGWSRADRREERAVPLAARGRYASGMVTIALDAMGSDLGPKVAVAGAAAASLSPGAPHVVLVGDEGVLRRLLTVHQHDRDKIRIAHAPRFVAQEDKPGAALD